MARLSALVATLVVLSCAAASAAGSAATPTTIKLFSVTVGVRVSATPQPPGLPRDKAPYEELVIHDHLFNGVRQFGRPRFARVGSDAETELRYRSGRRWVAVITHLPGGTIYVHGNLSRIGRYAVAKVTGGTGRYAGVRGTLAVLDLPDRGLAANVYRLTR
jgi:hypothetical protein